MIKQTRLSGEPISIRSDDDLGEIVEGYASVFNKRSRLIAEGGKVFYEVINPMAFSEVLADENLNTIANFQHIDSNMLARTKSKTLTLTTDEKGLKYMFVAPNTSLGKDIVEWLKRGDISESSFRYSFSEKDIVWSRAEDGIPVREITKVRRLLDVALVLNAAYSETDVALRELAEFESHEVAEMELQSSARKQELDNYYNKLQNKLNEFK